MEKEIGDEIFTWRALKVTFKSLQLFQQDSVFYSWSNFYDFFIIVMELLLGCYTLFLFVSTILYVRDRTTLVDEIKREKYKHSASKLPEYERKRLFKKRKQMTTEELCQAILGEPSLSFYSFLPYYDKSRNINRASRDYLSSKLH